MVSTALVEKIIVEVRDVSPTGTIVATGSRYVDGVEANRHGELAIPLSGLVDVSTLAGPNLFIGWYTVDKDGARTVSGTMVVVAPSTLQGYAGNTFRSTAASATWLAGDNFANLIGLVMLTGATVTTVREFAVRPRLIRQEQELMVLPTIIPAVVGRPSDIYFDGLTPLPKDTVKWRVACTDSTVTPMAERSRHVAAATGDVAIAYEAIDPFTGASLDIASATVRRVAANAGNGKSISWMAIGDSITYQDSTVAGHNGPGYVETVKTLSTAAVGAGTGPNVTCIGTIGPAGSKHEGYSGKSAPFFYSDPTSPFVFGGAFDFAQYMSTNGFAGVNYVSFLLGVNDGFNAVNDGDSTYYGTNSAAVIEAMIAGIHAYNAAIKVVVCAPTPPGSSQDPFGSAYRAGTGRWASHWGHKRNVVTFARVLRDHFESRSAESIYFAMPGLGLDTDHSYSRSINVIHDDITFTVAATYAGLVADLTPADGALYYATDIAKFFRKIGATTKGTWRLALEEDGVISRMSDGVHPNPTGKAQLGRKFWDWFKMMEV
jgi:lysophospholipase L1-like esterase